MVKRMLMILMIMMALLLFSSAAALSAPTVSINPPNLDAKTVGESMTFEVRISGVKDLYGFQFDIDFPATLMQVTKVERNSFMGSAANTFFIAGSIDNSAGNITGVAESKKGQVSGSSGDGTLLKVTIEVKKLAAGDIKLGSVKLVKSDVTVIAPVTVVGAGFEKSEKPAGETISEDTPESSPSSSNTQTGNTQAGSSVGSAGSAAGTQGSTPGSPAATQDTKTAVKSSSGTTGKNTGSGSSAKEESKTGSVDAPDGGASAQGDTRMADGSDKNSAVNEGPKSDTADEAKENKGFFGRIFSSIGSFFSSIFVWLANLFS